LTNTPRSSQSAAAIDAAIAKTKPARTVHATVRIQFVATD